MGKAVFYLALYVLAALLPLLLIAWLSGYSYFPFLAEVGKALALMAFMLIALQVVLAARFKGLDRVFGFDRIIRFHRYAALIALGFLILHPILLAAGGRGWGLLFSLDVPWYVMLGKAALFLLLVHILLSRYQRRLGLRFETWRKIHVFLGPAVFLIALAHSFAAGSDLYLFFIQWLWVATAAAVLCIWVYHHWVRPARLRSRAYEVIEVKSEAPKVWTVKLAPPKGKKRFDFQPGQFQFVTFLGNPDLPVEEHHWTISSSPSEESHVTSTIKELGDFTATIGQTKTGDKAIVHAPFGRFSYVHHPEDRDMVFIAGGIGITPLMSMLRHMRDTAADRTVTLLYANQTEADIAFKEELSVIAGGTAPKLAVYHVLGKPPAAWTGESGYIDAEKIRRLCGPDLAGHAFYLCGPPGLVDASLKTIRDLGVPDRRIRLEIFSFLD